MSHIFRCYLRLFDTPPKAAAEEAEAAAAGLPPAERKKLRQKQRKEAARVKKVSGVRKCCTVQFWLIQ